MNPARALHDLLERFSGTTQRTEILARWEEVLEVERGSPDFYRRHAEMMSLLGETFRLIEAFPADSRIRFQRSWHGWWSSLMAPADNWQASPSGFGLDLSNLDSLGHAADLIDARMGKSADTAPGTTLDALREASAEWVEVLAADEDLPEGLRESLLAELTHVLWLIDNGQFFGSGRVAERATTAVGLLLVASTQVDESRRRAWFARLQKFVSALALVQGLVTSVPFALEVAGTAASLVTGEQAAQPMAPGPDLPLDSEPQPTEPGSE